MLSLPNDDSAINAARAKFANGPVSTFIDTESRDGVLVNRLQLSVILDLALEIHLLKHVQGRLLSGVTEARPPLGLQRAS